MSSGMTSKWSSYFCADAKMDSAVAASSAKRSARFGAAPVRSGA